VKKKTADILQVLSDYFMIYLPDVKGLSKNTISSYQYAFQLLFEFLMESHNIAPEQVTFETLSGNMVTNYLNWLENSRKCSPKTRNQRRAAIVSFAKYSVKKSFTETMSFCSEVMDIPKKKIPKINEIKYFTKEEMQILLRLPDISRSIGQRDLILMSVLYSSGARAQEICDLKTSDIVFSNPMTVKLTGKGNKSRIVTIPDNCACLLKKYFDVRNFHTHTRNSDIRYVFSSQTHDKMSISCVEEIVKKYVKQAKQRHSNLFCQSSYSPHSFRHSIAVHMLESGVPLPAIQAFLGHAAISTTMIYVSVTPELANKYLSNRDTPHMADNIDAPNKSIINSLPFLRH